MGYLGNQQRFLTPQKTCNTILEGDARYCYIYGARSTFLENELLPMGKTI